MLLAEKTDAKFTPLRQTSNLTPFFRVCDSQTAPDLANAEALPSRQVHSKLIVIFLGLFERHEFRAGSKCVMPDGRQRGSTTFKIERDGP
jgi:hypothetical protein